MEEVKMGVVEMFGELTWKKNLHGSMGLSLFDEENEEDGRRWSWRERGEEKEIESL